MRDMFMGPKNVLRVKSGHLAKNVHPVTISRAEKSPATAPIASPPATTANRAVSAMTMNPFPPVNGTARARASLISASADMGRSAAQLAVPA